MPPLIADAAKKHGWAVGDVRQKTRLLWMSLGREDIVVYVWRDRWRHTTARAYRGNALSAILRTQREVASYLTT